MHHHHSSESGFAAAWAIALGGFLLTLAIVGYRVVLRHAIYVDAKIRSTSSSHESEEILSGAVTTGQREGVAQQQLSASGPPFAFLAPSAPGHAYFVRLWERAPYLPAYPDWQQLVALPLDPLCSRRAPVTRISGKPRGVSAFRCESAPREISAGSILRGNVAFSDLIVRPDADRLIIAALGDLEIERLQIISRHEEIIEIFATGNIRIGEAAGGEAGAHLVIHSSWGAIELGFEPEENELCRARSTVPGRKLTLAAARGISAGRQEIQGEALFGCPSGKSGNLWPPLKILGETELRS